MPNQILTSEAPFQGLVDKIGLIRRYMTESLRHPGVRSYAEEINVGENGKKSLNFLFENLKRVFKYMPDPVGVEYIKAPWVLVDEIQSRGWAAGDCDDMAALSYVLMRMVGYNAGLRVGWKNGNTDPSHIWNYVKSRTGLRIDFDLTTPRLGASHPNLTRVEDFS